MNLPGQADLEKEKEAIKKVINTAYLEGIQNEGNLEKIDSGIHPGFNLLGTGKGKEMWVRPIKEWKEQVVKKKSEGFYPRKGKDMVSIRFVSIDITGSAAIVKLEFFIGETLTYVDYISMYKFEDDWMMVAKIFNKMQD